MTRNENLFVSKIRKNVRGSGMRSKITKIRNYMNSRPSPMTEISVVEAASIVDSTEDKIAAHLSGSIWFEKTEKKGVYRLLNFPRKYVPKKQRLENAQKLESEKKAQEKPTEKEDTNAFGRKIVTNGITNHKQDLVRVEMNVSATNEQPAIDSKPEHSSGDELICSQHNSDSDNGVPLNQYFNGDKNKPVMSLKIITKKKHYCPHCEKEIVI